MSEPRPDDPGDVCCCPSLTDLAAVPMGGDGLDEQVFATIEQICDHGGGPWWLYLSKCRVCHQHWMVAQEERIFDTYFLRRLDATEARQVVVEADWPTDFITYERVLKLGRTLSEPFTFADPIASSLVWTVEDLRRERPDITIEEIADLIGVHPPQVARLLSA